MTTLTKQYLIEAIHLEADHLRDALLAPGAALRALTTGEGYSAGAAREAYVRLLRLSIDYVQFTVPALRAAGQAMLACAHAEPGATAWGAWIEGYARGELAEGAGHEAWAREDMAELGVPSEGTDWSPHLAAIEYGRYFVDDACHHPWAVLGAKGVLENLSIRAAPPILRDVARLGISHGADVTRFLRHHGEIDQGHVREGELDLQELTPSQRCQVLVGAYVTSGTYRQLLRHYFPA